MATKKTPRSADSAAKAKKAPAAKKAAKKTATKKPAKTAAAKKAPAKSGARTATRSYSLSGADVTGKNLVIVESPAKGKTIK